MKQSFLIFILLSLLLLPACQKIKNKSKEITNQTQQTLKEKSKDLSDKVLPHFDAYQPDTKFNKERFKDFLQVDLTPDIKNIYCFDDAIGIDADYQFSFNCDTSTAARIIKKHSLTLDKETTDYAFGLQNDFPWWDKKKIEKLELHSWKDDQYYKYFWYDTKEQKGYYFDFDM